MAPGEGAARVGRDCDRRAQRKLKVTLGDETEVLQPPHGKDIDQQTIVDLRRMLTRAGRGPAG
jgi:hypothetical protein